MAPRERDLTSSSDEQRPTSHDDFGYKKSEGPLFVNRRNRGDRGDVWQQNQERRARLIALREEQGAVDAAGVDPMELQVPVVESNGTNGTNGNWMSGPRRMTLTEAWTRTADVPEDDTFISRTRSSSAVENNSAIQTSLEDELLPPHNIPKTWGSKAKRKPDWMRKILDPDLLLPSVEDGSAIPTPPASNPASSPQLANASPEKSKLWDADLDFTAQSLQIATSPQLRVKSAKVDEIRSREIQNLTARAVATSRLEEIRERNSEERSISSESRSNTKDVPPKEDPGSEEWHHRSILEEEGEKIPYTPITVFRAKDFEEYAKRNNVAFGRDRSNSGSSSSSRPNSLEGQLPTGKSASSFAPNFGEGFKKKRDEQRDLLRRLSRACSSSPSSSPAPPKVEEKEEKEKKEEKKLVKHSEKVTNLKIPDTLTSNLLKSGTLNHSDKVNHFNGPESQQVDITKSDTSKPEESNHSDPVNHLRTSDTPSALDPALAAGSDTVDDLKTSETPPSSKSDVDPEERITAEAMLFELQDNKSERNSIRAPSPSPSEDGKVDDTPRPKPNPLSLPTPRVTGAYIESPAPITRVTKKLRSISPSYQVVDVLETAKNSRSKPRTTLSERYRTDREPRQKSISPETRGRFRDSRPLINTANHVSAAEDVRRIQLESQADDSTLDDFDAVIEAEAATEGQTTILEPVLDLEYDERGLPLSEKEIDRRIERLTLDRMKQSLKATSTSIRDARHGIERLAEQVSSSSIKTAQPHDGTMYINFKIPVPKLYISDPVEKSGMKSRWKLTWLGSILSLFFVWWVCESAMCAQFCHPVASSKNTWQPSDPFFPWAIPTKLDQWTGEIVSSSLGSVASSLGIRNWDWSPIPTLARNYKGGPIGSSDWWLGRSGPVGLMPHDIDKEGIFSDDEMI